MTVNRAALILATLAISSVASAEAPVVRNSAGAPLTHPKVVGFDGQNFSVAHDGGVAKVPFETMPAELRGNAVFQPGAANLSPSLSVAVEKIKTTSALSRLKVITPMEFRPKNEAIGMKAFVVRGRISLSKEYFRLLKAGHPMVNEKGFFAFRVGNSETETIFADVAARPQPLVTLIKRDPDGQASGCFFIMQYAPDSYTEMFDWCPQIDFDAMALKWASMLPEWDGATAGAKAAGQLNDEGRPRTALELTELSEAAGEVAAYRGTDRDIFLRAYVRGFNATRR